MRPFYLFVLTIIWLFGLAPFSAQAAEDYIVSRAVLEDPSGKLSIQQVEHADFKPVGLIFSDTYTSAVHWLRIVVKPPKNGGVLKLDIRPAFLDEVILFEPSSHSTNGWVSQVTGDRTRFLERESARVQLGFLIKPVAAATTYYLRFTTTSASIIKVQALLTHQAEINNTQLNLVQWFYLSLMLGLLFLAINDYFVSRDRVVAWFVLYQSTYIFYELASLGYIAPLVTFAPAGLIDSITNIALWAMTLVTILFHHALLNLFNPSNLRKILFGLMCTVVAIIWIILMLGQVSLAMQLNEWLVLALAPIFMFLAFSARLDTPPGLTLLRIMYVLMTVSMLPSMLTMFGWVEALEWNLYAALLQGLIASGLMFLLLNFRSRELQRAGVEASLNLVTVKQKLAFELELYEKRSRFIDMLSHELKTPLSVIRLTLGMNASTEVDRHRGLRSVLEINTVIERCLQTDQMEQGQFRLEQSPCIIASLLDSLRCDSVELQQLTIETGVLPTINTDYQLLRIVLSNLIDNALKYAKPLSLVHISAQLDEDKGRPCVLITVANQPGNAGMPDAQQVFTKYYRSPGARSKTGSGLGLYLVYGLVDMLGGTVRYQPSTDEVRFELWLPL